MTLLVGILLATLTFTNTILANRQLVQSPSRDNSPECDCYLTSGPDLGYFQHHRFFDFRNIDSSNSNDYTTPPPLITNSQFIGSEPVTSDYFTTHSWQNDWYLSDWSSNTTSPDGSIEQVASPQNVYITRNATNSSNTYLILRSNRLRAFQSVAEINSNQKNLYHSSIRARLRVLPNDDESETVAAGAVLGFFIYESDTAESDIEILTSDPPTQIHYSNQPDFNAKTDSEVPGASSNVSLPGGKVWTEWLDHRIDWFEGVSRWYLDDKLVLNKTLNVPRQPSGLILNLWSDGGQWSGNMSVGRQVRVGVEWVQMVFNVSGSVNGPSERNLMKTKEKKGCKTGCWVDGPAVRNVGFPEVAFVSEGIGTRREGFGVKYGIVAICAGFLLLV